MLNVFEITPRRERLRNDTTAALGSLLPLDLMQVAAEGGSCFAVLVDGEPVGCISLLGAPPAETPAAGIIGQLAILPEQRRRGYATLLLCSAASRCLDQSRYFLAAPPPQSPEAAAFAEKLRFAPSQWHAGLWLLALEDLPRAHHHK